ncbi:MAG: carbohydrate ABC transporter substrate-binding protein [Proteobacteria bacterium]|nr:carbohydrate ABC transporter substrate-binding protein [Pseudomonadota bacterium]
MYHQDYPAESVAGSPASLTAHVPGFLCWFSITIASIFNTQAIAGPDADLRLLSTQLSPPHEARAMRDEILSDFSQQVVFQAYSMEKIFQLLVLARESQGARTDVVGALHGDFASLSQFDIFSPVGHLLESLGPQRFVGSHLALGRMKSPQQKFIPWMQATYLMVANRRALKHLPDNVDLNHLSYAQLREWAENMRREAGRPKLGFPAGSGGLMHRFFQGYLYPSYTASTVTGFKSAEARLMWREFRELWLQVNKRSLTYARMDKALLAEEVWVAWDHTARLSRALQERPEDFIAFPSPVGPRGRGFMLVLAGLAIPRDTASPETAESLIEYLTRTDTQIKTLENVGFFPTVTIPAETKTTPGITSLQEAVAMQSGAQNSVMTLFPVGLKNDARAFNLAYMGAFSGIVLRGRDIATVLEEQAGKINRLLRKNNISCWLPDPEGPPPCQAD